MEPYLYLLIRNDLPSLNPGKAIAHGAHAANQFAWHMEHYYSKHKHPKPVYTLYKKWANSTPSGFGTTIALSASFSEIGKTLDAASMSLNDYQGDYGVTEDPTYPYVVNQEIASLIDPKLHTQLFVVKSPSIVVCFRKEVTAAYVFGDKEMCQPVLGHLPLVP